MDSYAQRQSLCNDIAALESTIGRMEGEKNDIYFQIRMIEGQIDYFRRHPLPGEIERLEIHKAMLNGRFLEVQGKIGDKHAELRVRRAQLAQLDRS
uniref:Uncharacterized protein n=1 Tax=Bionectria ochroleuca TaxID=29856 RepID=A0A8H7TNE9_BIOOC